jgi:hypothetical protein
LKQQEEPLEAKVDLRRSLFGDAWEDCLILCRKLQNTFGSQPTEGEPELEVTGELDELIEFSTLWRQKRTLTELTSKKGISVPDEQLWKEAGYSPGQIEAMKKMDTYKANWVESLWKAAASAKNAGMSLEGFLKTAGFSDKEIAELLATITTVEETEPTEETPDEEVTDEENLD